MAGTFADLFTKRKKQIDEASGYAQPPDATPPPQPITPLVKPKKKLPPLNKPYDPADYQ